MFSGKSIPSVGFSFGIERLFVILEDMNKNAAWLRGPATHVLVATIGKGLAFERFKLATELWKAGINAEMLHEENTKPQKFISHALDNMVPFIIWLGSDEIEAGQAKVKVSSNYSRIEILTSLVHLQERGTDGRQSQYR